jgi:hypothetical protein
MNDKKLNHRAQQGVYDTPRGLPIWNLTRFNLSLLGGLITCSKHGARHTPPAVVPNGQNSGLKD